MDIKTYRARSLQEALNLVRQDIGPSAAVLHTRELRRGLLGWLPPFHRFEVTASANVCVPSRLHSPAADEPRAVAASPAQSEPATDAAKKNRVDEELKGQLHELQVMVEELCRRGGSSHHDWPESLFEVYTELIDADMNEDVAREMVENVRREVPRDELADPVLIKARLARKVEADIPVAGPIQLEPGRCRVVALIGPTGVGKTTTVAKLAANFRLREKRRVGLITVDTYRIAAVEQLRTYADIIDLPMQVVSTPRETREAVQRLGDLDLILMDTAGRSPRDEVKIQELKAFLAEAHTDEVQLVLSTSAGGNTLRRTAERFAPAAPNRLLLTKIDEASGLGNLLPLVQSSGLPLSYVTAGQNVPDDIEPARAAKLARWMLDPSALGAAT